MANDIKLEGMSDTNLLAILDFYDTLKRISEKAKEKIELSGHLTRTEKPFTYLKDVQILEKVEADKSTVLSHFGEIKQSGLEKLFDIFEKCVKKDTENVQTSNAWVILNKKEQSVIVNKQQKELGLYSTTSITTFSPYKAHFCKDGYTSGIESRFRPTSEAEVDKIKYDICNKSTMLDALVIAHRGVNYLLRNING